MTRVFYDCEFLENGSTIELISIGMVREDGAEYYAISQEMPFGRISRHSWLMKHVMPSLPVRTGHAYPWDREHPDFRHVKPRHVIAREVQRFITAVTDPQLWAWYGAYDHVALCQLWGCMIALPDGVPMWTNDLRQECERLGNPQMPEQAAGEHNALADARHNLTMARFLDGLAGTDSPAAPVPPPALTKSGRLAARVQVLEEAIEKARGFADLGAKCMRDHHPAQIAEARAIAGAWKFHLETERQRAKRAEAVRDGEVQQLRAEVTQYERDVDRLNGANTRLAREAAAAESEVGRLGFELADRGVQLQDTQAAVARARAFAAEMRGYCSPHGVSALYADRLEARIDGRQDPA